MSPTMFLIRSALLYSVLLFSPSVFREAGLYSAFRHLSDFRLYVEERGRGEESTCICYCVACWCVRVPVLIHIVRLPYSSFFFLPPLGISFPLMWLQIAAGVKKMKKTVRGRLFLAGDYWSSTPPRVGPPTLLVLVECLPTNSHLYILSLTSLYSFTPSLSSRTLHAHIITRHLFCRGATCRNR